MNELGEILLYTAGFAIVAVASHRIAQVFLKIRFPLITGFLLTGLAAGPFIFGLLDQKGVEDIAYLNDLSLAFIAFAAGSELFLKELRSRIRSIAWNTISQLFITMILGSGAVFFLADMIPFMRDMDVQTKVAVSLLSGVIFVARSPASAIAVINEMRAKGPFVQVALGVTVVKDVLVIILFAIIFSVSDTLITGKGFSGVFIPFLLGELILSFGLGLLLGRIMSFVLKQDFLKIFKIIFVLGIGFSVYLLSGYVKENSHEWIGHEVYLEPLLICIIGSFWLTNYSSARGIFHEILEETGPYIYVIFFTLTGASMSLDVLAKVWLVAVILFGVRLISMVIAGYVGGTLGKDPKEFRAINWMPYVTQAGVGLGLAIVVADTYPTWGKEFATIIVGVIVINQLVGPPLFKWAISKVGEDHSGMPTPEFDGVRDAILFGLGQQSLALARELLRHDWKVKIVTYREDISEYSNSGLDIRQTDKVTAEFLKEIDTEQAEAIVGMMTDEHNYEVCELAYEHLGTKDLIVLMNDPANTGKFKELGVQIVHPATALIGLLDHMVRSPQATRLLLGMEEGQDTIELEVQDESLHGILLRDLKLPSDVIMLSLRRGEQVVIPHGYTRLRRHDFLTVVGSQESLDKVSLRLAAE